MLTLFILAIISIIVYYCAPMSYSYEYTLVCLTLFIISSVVVLKRNCRDTIIRFEFFFLISFFFTYYVYSLVYYPENPYFSLFTLTFNESYITKGLALATVGCCFFNFAIYEKRKNNLRIDTLYNKRQQKPRTLLILLFFVFLPYLLSLALQREYTTAFEDSYVNVVLQYVIYYYIYVSFYNISKFPNIVALIKEFGVLPLILLSTYVLLFLIIGSRTIPMRIILFTLIIYNIYYRKISKKIVLPIGIMAMFFMAFIGVNRTGYAIGTGSAWDFAVELVINNRSLYVLMEYYDQFGATMGRTLLMNILSMIPFAQSVFLKIFGWSENDISSASMITHLYYKDVADYEKMIGLGTNIIGDIYVSFGFVGVVVLMYFFGRFLKRLYNRSYDNKNYVLIYSIIFMDAIYMTRSSLLVSLRAIIWVLAIMYISNRIILHNNKIPTKRDKMK